MKKIFGNNISNEGVIPKINKDHFKVSSKKVNHPIIKEQKN
jgi:hypothetical protein